ANAEGVVRLLYDIYRASLSEGRGGRNLNADLNMERIYRWFSFLGTGPKAKKFIRTVPGPIIETLILTPMAILAALAQIRIPYGERYGYRWSIFNLRTTLRVPYADFLYRKFKNWFLKQHVQSPGLKEGAVQYLIRS